MEGGKGGALGTVSEGPNQKATFWSQFHGEGSPVKSSFVALGAGEAIIWEQKADSSFLESERQVIHCCSATLRASALGNSQYDFLFSSFFDQRPPGSVPAVLLGFQPALALTGALCLQQVLSTCCLRVSG